MEISENQERPSENAVAAHLVRAETAEIFPTDERLGILHPTSIEMLTRMLRSGKLLDRSGILTQRNETRITGLVTPGLIRRLPSLSLNSAATALLDRPAELRDHAVVRAGFQAEELYFMTQLGLSLDDPDILSKANEYVRTVDPDSEAFFNHYGASHIHDRAEIDAASELLPFLRPEFIGIVPDALAKARERKGFLVGVDVTTPELAHPEGFQGHSEDMIFSLGSAGMPYTAITAIEPLGFQEEKFLDDLRRTA